ncbi:hypothetical protein FSP39_009823 [Pinctada imbricata]|uniref:G-protein coupled receptors family 1 profile domain-containing protein n=1 Tax=Pinctada imbricata TaxID=66713 RepID=A0AA88YIR2_PINIB|nr:hypothetical protein FSP39_009823 [Pinctada imbricata]
MQSQNDTLTMSEHWQKLKLNVLSLYFLESYAEDEAQMNTSTVNEGWTTNVTSYTTNAEYISYEDIRKINFVFGNVLIPALSLFGTVGNIFCLIVLFHSRMRNASTACLAALSFSDLLFLLHCLLFSVLSFLAFCDKEKGAYYRAIFYPIFGAYGSPATGRITSWLTLLLGVERFIAVKYPIKARVMCNKFSTIVVIVAIYVTTLLLFLPYAMKYRVVYGSTNESGVVKVTASIQRTELGMDNRFFGIYGTIMNILFRFLPVIVLVIVNSVIIYTTRDTWKLRRQMNSSVRGSAAASDQTHFTVMLVTVCIVFIICLVPGAVHSLISHIWKDYNRFGKARNLFQLVSRITFFCETINSSVNFVIYMVMSQKFKRTYKDIFTCNKRILSYGSSLVSHSKDISPLMENKRQWRNSPTNDAKTSLINVGKISKETNVHLRS